MNDLHNIVENGAACWDPYREGQIQALDRVAAKFAYNTNESTWETLRERRKMSRICAVFKAYSVERAWKAIGDIKTALLSEQGRS